VTRARVTALRARAARPVLVSTIARRRLPGDGAARAFTRARAAFSGLSRAEQAGLVGLAVVTFISLTAGLLAPYGASEATHAGALQGPSLAHPFGTDEQARDVLSRVIFGIRTSWLSALCVIGIGAAFGALVGLVAGVASGFVDSILMRTTDLFLALPAPVLAIAVVAAMGPSLVHVLIALTVVWWPWYARIVRGEVRALAVRPHADAARVAGVGRVRLALRHLLPGAFPAVLVTMSLDVGNLVLALAALSFIGLGAPPPAPELGSMAARGLDYLLGHAWVPLFPALAVTLLALCANLSGDGVARALHREGGIAR
jgi:peptide/nickel transport system permease protein